MKKIFYSSLFLFIIFLSACSTEQKNAEVTLVNETNLERIDEYVEIDLSKLDTENKNLADLSLSLGDSLIAFQNVGENLVGFVTDFAPDEEKVLTISFDGEKRLNPFEPRTYAEIAMKVNYEKRDGKYLEGDFKTFDSLKIPDDHTDHDALFKYEGPGWESEKVGYRMYIDWRNRIDIFGKKTNELVLKEVGINDKDAEDDSYHEMQDWGMDIFKVGGTLGIGTYGMRTEDGFTSVEERDSVYVQILENGPILSKIKIDYYGWKVEDKKFDLTAGISITAGSRLTKIDLETKDNPDGLLTGVAKHEDTDFLNAVNEGEWSYIGLYGKQSLAEDTLGIALFYNRKDLLVQNEDEENYFVELKPVGGKVKYYFCAAWEKEPEGIKSEKDFKQYLDNKVEMLNNPIKVEFKGK